MANEKKSFIIRIDAETLAAIEKWAADEFRSINSQIEWILSESLKKAKRMPRKHSYPTLQSLSPKIKKTIKNEVFLVKKYSYFEFDFYKTLIIRVVF
jgi:hypothetical protein